MREQISEHEVPLCNCSLSPSPLGLLVFIPSFCPSFHLVLHTLIQANRRKAMKWQQSNTDTAILTTHD